MHLLADLLNHKKFRQESVEGCMHDCSLALLYLDAKHLGLEEYQRIIQLSNVVCVGYGPVLDEMNQTLLLCVLGNSNLMGKGGCISGCISVSTTSVS